jgi:thiamine-phosphate pyrophosphorylase
MPHRQPYQRPIPKVWLMTDPRLGDGLLKAIRKLPAGSGVIFRHYHLPDGERHRLFMAVRRVCRQRGHRLLLAGETRWSADGVHGRGRPPAVGLYSAPVHNIREIAEAKRMGADLILVSPLFATRSHPGAPALGMMRFAALARLAYPAKVIALGGMTRNRARAISRHIAQGWAAIDAFKV